PQLSKKEKPSVKRSVSMLIIGMALHNIPEGLALGSGLALSFSLGLSIAIVLALHDIPENIATIIPLYSLNRKRLKSFLITTSTILFELVGFLFAFFIPFSHKLIGILLASAAGFMLYISTEELLPNSNFKEYPRAVLVSILLSIIIFLVIIFSTLLM
ncbi:ZIP family metal transporter, partial [Candidatus Pacearchaeota archaeon]|nr:ZIP family metal transporter [Candidatus Pacearchaeota archaeon]